MLKIFKRLFQPLKKVLPGLIVLSVLASCEWGDRNITLVRPNTDNLQVVFTDTVTVLRSTVMKDSLYSAAGNILAGQSEDALLGKVQARGFVLPLSQGGISLPEKSMYDSLVLVTRYNYNYGDTTRLFNLAVHELKQDITQGPYYNQRGAEFEKTALGKKSFYPRPRSNDSLRVTLNNQLGEKIFEHARTNRIIGQEGLINLFKGVVFLAEPGSNAGFLGFLKDRTQLILYYHTDGPDGKEKHSVAIPAGQFYNQIVNDRKGTRFEPLAPSARQLSSTKTEEITVIQSGVGLMTRLDFPYVRGFGSDLGKVIINRAFLRIQLPSNPENPSLRPPAKLGLYPTSSANEWELNSSPVAVAVFHEDQVYNERYYEMDVSTLLMQMVQEKSDNSYGFLLGPLAPGNSEVSIQSNSLERLVLPKGSVKLRVYFTTLIE